MNSDENTDIRALSYNKIKLKRKKEKGGKKKAWDARRGFFFVSSCMSMPPKCPNVEAAKQRIFGTDLPPSRFTNQAQIYDDAPDPRDGPPRTFGLPGHAAFPHAREFAEEHEEGRQDYSKGPKRERRRNGFVSLDYHFEEDKDWVLMGQDLHPHKHAIQTRANIYFAFALSIELVLIAWPVTAIFIWGFRQAVLTFAFAVHFIKVLFLLAALLTETHVFKMYGRRSYAFFWGLWTRRSHVRSSGPLSMYGFVYGWIQVPIMCTYIVLALTAYPLFMSRTLFWIQWPMGFVSLALGYIAWCVIVSEMAIRKNLEQYVPFTAEQRRQARRRKEGGGASTAW